MRPGAVSTYQTPTSRASTQSCRILSRMSGGLLALVGLQHLLLHDAPDLAVKIEEGGGHADLRDVPRPRQLDLEIADRPRTRASRQHDDAVGERDRLLEIVGDEQHGFPVL